jgi:hypothetical protein
MTWHSLSIEKQVQDKNAEKAKIFSISVTSRGGTFEGPSSYHHLCGWSLIVRLGGHIT